MSVDEFPEHVMEEILCRLPVKEVVRTSALSRAWHRRWQWAPVLSFDGDLPPAVIDKVLLAHSAPIEVLCINIPFLGDDDYEELDEEDEESTANYLSHWLVLLSRRHPDALKTLCLCRWWKTPISSLVLSSFRSLTYLSLQQCSLSPPPPPVGLPSGGSGGGGFPLLRTLILSSVALSEDDDHLSALLSGCPSLEELLITDVDFGHLRIHNPNLRIFHLQSVRCESVTFVGGQILEKVHLRRIHVHGKKFIDLPDFFGNAVCTGKLSLGNIRIVEAFATPFHFQQLKFLTMHVVAWGNIGSIHLIHSLLRSAPNLQQLHIRQYYAGYMMMCNHYGNNSLHLQDFERQVFWNQPSTIRLDKLRTVEMHNTRFLEPQMGFIQFLLTRAPVLEKLILVTVNNSTLEGLDRRRESALEVLNKCHKSSTQTQIQITAAKYYYS